MAHEAVTVAAGSQMVIGTSAALLGILALVGIVRTLLVLIGLLAVGTSPVLSGGALGGKLIGPFRRG